MTSVASSENIHIHAGIKLYKHLIINLKSVYIKGRNVRYTYMLTFFCNKMKMNGNIYNFPTFTTLAILKVT